MKYKQYNVTPVFTTYVFSGNLAMYLEQDGSMVNVVTVNIDDELDIEQLTNEQCAFIDINNMGEDICVWLEENEFGKFTGNVGFSGFCVYPEFEFDKQVIERYKKGE